MAAAAPPPPTPPPASSPAPPQDPATGGDALASYLGLSFAFFLASLPGGTPAARHLASLQSRGRVLATRLLAAEDQLRQLRAAPRRRPRQCPRRRDLRRPPRLLDGQRAPPPRPRHRRHRRGRLLRARLAEAEADAAALRARVDRLEREAAERDDLINALLAATRAADADLRATDDDPEPRDAEQHHHHQPAAAALDLDPAEPRGADADAEALAAAAALYAQQRQQQEGFGSDDFYTAAAAAAASGMQQPWMERSKGWQVRRQKAGIHPLSLPLTPSLFLLFSTNTLPSLTTTPTLPLTSNDLTPSSTYILLSSQEVVNLLVDCLMLILLMAATANG